MTRRTRTDTPGVYKLESGSYLALWRDRDGRQRERRFRTKREARAWKMAAEGEKAQGRALPVYERTTFGDYHAAWWAATKPTLARATVAQYESWMRTHVLPYFAHRRLLGIDTTDIRAFVGHMATKNVGPRTQAGALTRVRAVLEAAAFDGKLPANPAEGVKSPKVQGSEKRALTVAEVETLAAALRVQWQIVVRFLAYTGLRPGELAALQRRDFDGQQLRVHAAISEVAGRIERREVTKNYMARVVPVAGGMADELAAHLERIGPGKPDDPLFPTRHGGVIHYTNMGRMVRRAAKRTGLGHVTPYMLRHTCATQLARAGVPVHVAARFMGHDPAVFLRTYAHLFDGDLLAAAEAGAARELPPSD